MNKRTIFTIGGTLLVSCLFTNAIVKTQGDEKVINKQLATYSYKDNYFIIPDSSDRYLTEYDLSGLTKDQLEIARNEIYARHGYQFQQQKMINYFNNQSWYVKSNKKVTTDDLSELEMQMLYSYKSLKMKVCLTIMKFIMEILLYQTVVIEKLQQMN